MGSKKLLTTLRRRGGGPSIIADGLIADWRMDDGSGQQVTDYSGNDYHLQLGANADAGGDAADPTWSSEGLTFASGDYLTSNQAALRPDAYTAMFVYADSEVTATIESLLGWMSDYGAAGPALYARINTTNKPLNYISSVGSDSYKVHLSPVALNDGSYRVLTFTCPGTSNANAFLSSIWKHKTELAVDLVKNEGDPYEAKSAFRIGQARYPLVAKLASVALYSRVLSESEIGSNVDYYTAVLATRGVTVNPT